MALAFGLNANLVRQWLRGRGFKQVNEAVAAPATPLARAGERQFVPLGLPPALRESSSPAAGIRIEVRRGALHVNVTWPSTAAADCAGWLRELLR